MFLKRNNSRFSDALFCEAEGLSVLAAATAETDISVPTVFSVDSCQMALTEITAGRCLPKQMAILGKGLAVMHRKRQTRYGWQRDNYIGLNPQANTVSDHWGEFFVAQRLRYQMSLINDARLRDRFQQRLVACESRLVAFLNSHCGHASLVHGDLWSGNYLCGDDGRVWLIDPAVYCGDREVDLAMSEMFGGFHSSFYQAYDDEYPRSEHYAIKRPIYNFYHYLNHFNLFGEAYLDGCEAGMRAIEDL
ncbi:fructosamine-3-kinase [Spongiibacter sp. IMCC21906]|uniref:fructosamine kinase family protein n=1 Tax=Spongiibacter sp. IMCC21906 TaxID=1620392 RepID=UPI00062DEED8|nr:fructosamine kinase family protein [Spongiibacter sp. IMCC21906]AKH70876.1 fructosamine-3-kinase [Spongiibacter sp. IMCC21906]